MNRAAPRVGDVRQCPRCGREVVVTENRLKDRHYLCHPCKGAKFRQWRAANPERYRAYLKRRSQQPRYVAIRKAAARRRLDNKLKSAADAAVKGAIASGALVRQPCERCGKAKADAHHDDYSKPLDVRWLCRRHHLEYHHPPRDLICNVYPMRVSCIRVPVIGEVWL